MCGFWLWEEHETEARRYLANSKSPEPQTPSKLRYSSIEPPSQNGASTGSKSASLNGGTSDRVLRSARQPTPVASQAHQFTPRIKTPHSEDGLPIKVLDLLEHYHIELNDRQRRKLHVLIDDYIEEIETELSLCKEQLETMREAEEDRYVVD